MSQKLGTETSATRLDSGMDVTPRKTDKRTRLVDSAMNLIRQQGFNLTTLADIAQEADVPLGNVYYYFKTKEAIGISVIEKRAQEWAERLSTWNEQSESSARLSSLVQFLLEDVELMARYGCPIGGLCQELGKQGGALADLAAKLLHDILNWTESQFKSSGLNEVQASNAALSLISSIQGAYLLTHTFKDPKICDRQASMIQAWLKQTVESKVAVALA